VLAPTTTASTLPPTTTTTTTAVTETTVPQRPSPVATASSGAPAIVPGAAPTGSRSTHVPVTTTTVAARSPSTTTTTAPAATWPSTRNGTFGADSASVSERLGPVTTVTVYLETSSLVTLSVRCGLHGAHATAHGSAQVHLLAGASSCTAVISVPAATPRPTSWRLVAS